HVGLVLEPREEGVAADTDRAGLPLPDELRERRREDVDDVVLLRTLPHVLLLRQVPVRPVDRPPDLVRRRIADHGQDAWLPWPPRRLCRLGHGVRLPSGATARQGRRRALTTRCRRDGARSP